MNQGRSTPQLVHQKFHKNIIDYVFWGCHLLFSEIGEFCEPVSTSYTKSLFGFYVYMK